jgi:hypothetical protein
MSRGVDDGRFRYARFNLWPEIRQLPGYAAVLAKIDAQEVSH